jgi:hypothetical protein
MRVRVNRRFSRGLPLSGRKLERIPTVYGDLTVGWWSWDPSVPMLVARITDSPRVPLRNSCRCLPTFRLLA